MEKCGEVAKSCGCDLLVIKLLERILVMFQQRTHISSLLVQRWEARKYFRRGP